MKKALLVLTTAGILHFLRDAVATMEDPLDILVVDDGSPPSVGIVDFCAEKKLPIAIKKHPLGLTNSWNIGYDYMMKHEYDYCIISNDDVRFAKGFSKGLFQGMEEYAVVCPVSNLPTKNDQRFRPQWAKRYCGLPMNSRKKNRNLIQKALSQKYATNSLQRVTTFNGFCFAFSRAIKKYMYSGAHLFNPGLINTKNEFELARRIKRRGGKVAVCKIAYVFHWKNGTFGELKLAKKDWLWPNSPIFKEN